MKNLFIILDNGHGVETAGKRSPDSRLFEWSWNRMMVDKLKTAFSNEGWYVHVLVPEESDVSLGNRVLRANTLYKNLNKDEYEVVLLSVHVNAAASDGKWHKARGFSSWVYDNCSKKSAKLGYIFGSLADVNGLSGNRWIPSEFCHRANFKILRESVMPAVLLENMFQDNHEDVDFLLSEEGVDKLVKLYVDAMKLYESYINKDTNK